MTPGTAAGIPSGRLRHIYITSQPEQEAALTFCKRSLLHCQKQCFTRQKTASCTVKGCLWLSCRFQKKSVSKTCIFSNKMALICKQKLKIMHLIKIFLLNSCTISCNVLPLRCHITLLHYTTHCSRIINTSNKRKE